MHSETIIMNCDKEVVFGVENAIVSHPFDIWNSGEFAKFNDLVYKTIYDEIGINYSQCFYNIEFTDTYLHSRQLNWNMDITIDTFMDCDDYRQLQVRINFTVARGTQMIFAQIDSKYTNDASYDNGKGEIEYVCSKIEDILKELTESL